MIEKLSEDMKTAMKNKDSFRLNVLRMMKSKIMTVSTKGVQEEEAQKIIKTYAKNLKEAIDQFRKGGSEAQAQETENELAVVQEYLPAEASTEEVSKKVDEAIAQTGATSIKDMGKVMKAVMSSGLNVDGNTVKDLVLKKLN